MRINEFTDAKEQLALLRLIVDNTWTAIAQQAKAQEAQKAATTSTAKAIKKPTKAALNIAANLGAKANQNAAQQQHQVKQSVQQVHQVPHQPSQSRPLSNTIKPVSTTQNMSTANNPNMQPQITPAPLKK
jgi:type VI protein secretion system component VasK